MAKKKATPPQAEQFEEVAPPESGSEQVFTTSTPKSTKGRIVSDDTATEADVSGPDPLRPATSSTSLEDAEKLGRELGQVPLGAKKPNKRASRTSAAKAQVTRSAGTDAYTDRILTDINTDREATHELGLQKKIRGAAKQLLMPLYQAHKDQGGCDETGPYKDKCPTLLGQDETFDGYLKSHSRLKHVREAVQGAIATASDKIRNKKNPITGELDNAYKPVTAEDLHESHTAQHVERLYKLSDMLYDDHVQRSQAAGTTPLPKEAYSPDKVRAAINTHISMGTNKTLYSSFLPGVGKRVRTAQDQAAAVKELPSISLWWNGKGTDAPSHQGLVSALFSSMGRVRSRNAQKQNPGSGISRKLGYLPGDQKAAAEEAYDADTRTSQVLPETINPDLHKILGARHAESRQRTQAEGMRRSGVIDNEQARNVKTLAKTELQATIPTLTGEQLDANVERAGAERDAAEQEAYETHESQHAATSRANRAKVRNGSPEQKAAAMFDTCHDAGCNQARRAAVESGAKGIDFETWKGLHGVAHESQFDETGRPVVTDEMRNVAAAENRKRANVALSPRTPNAVGDLLTQGNNTADGSGTTVPNNNADGAVDHLSQIQSAIKSGAILIPGGRGAVRDREVSPEAGTPLKPVLNKNISQRHFSKWKSMPNRVQQQMLSVGLEHHDRFISDYDTHNANERNKVQAADEAGQMYKPQDFNFKL